MNKTKALLIFLLIIVNILSFVTSYAMHEYTDKAVNAIMMGKNNSKCETCMLYNPKVKFGLDGIYHHSGKYYCVWTEGRDFKEINKTEYHEVCHSFIHEDYYHFCEESYE